MILILGLYNGMPNTVKLYYVVIVRELTESLLDNF